VIQAIAKMVAKNVGSLVVLDERGAGAQGIITERDYLRRVALEGRSSRTTFVREIMSPRLVHVGQEVDIEECMVLMTRHRIRHLPVLEEGRLVGILSMGDIIKQLADHHKAEVNELTAYVQGRYS
jgi:signal-transduction protein with cAMP-binding, CBS, and nucleotidyltransferase domain